MNPKLINDIRNVLRIVMVRKQLNEYLEKKEINSGDLIYPPAIQDLQESIPDISNRVEITPFMEEMDPTTGAIKIGWNLFVLGINRKFLGYTVHESLDELKRPSPSKKALENSLCYTTGEDVVGFIVETLQKYDDEHISLGSIKFNAPQVYAAKLPIANGYYEKNKSVGRTM